MSSKDELVKKQIAQEIHNKAIDELQREEWQKEANLTSLKPEFSSEEKEVSYIKNSRIEYEDWSKVLAEYKKKNIEKHGGEDKILFAVHAILISGTVIATNLLYIEKDPKKILDIIENADAKAYSTTALDHEGIKNLFDKVIQSLELNKYLHELNHGAYDTDTSVREIDSAIDKIKYASNFFQNKDNFHEYQKNKLAESTASLKSDLKKNLQSPDSDITPISARTEMAVQQKTTQFRDHINETKKKIEQSTTATMEEENHGYASPTPFQTKPKLKPQGY